MIAGIDWSTCEVVVRAEPLRGEAFSRISALILQLQMLKQYNQGLTP